MPQHVKYDVLKSRPVAFIQSASSAASLEEIAKAVSLKWNLHRSRLFLNLISDETVFNQCHTEIMLQKTQELTLGFKNLFETDIYPVLFTPGRLNDPLSVLVGHAALEAFEQASYAREVDSIDCNRPTHNKSVNFKLIAVNSAKLLEENCAHLEPNHTHLILIEDANVTEADIIKFRLQLSKFLSDAISKGTCLLEDDDPSERYVSVPIANHFYEIPKSRKSFAVDTFTFAPSIVLYFGLTKDDLSWMVYALNEKVSTILFENSSPVANFLSALVRNYSKESNLNSVEKLVENKCRNTKELCADLQNISQLSRLVAGCKGNNVVIANIFMEKCLDPLPYFVALALKNNAEMNEEPAKFLRLLLKLNVSSVLTNVKVEPNFVNSNQFYQFFEEVLTNPTKECFVKWFLNSSGFKLSQFLTSDRLIQLFKIGEPREFFNNVILGNLLGYVSFPHDVLKFVKVDLKQLFYHLTSKMIKLKDVEFDLEQIRLTTANDFFLLEKRCMDLLVFWAALMKRSSLVKLLWSYSYDPLPLALVLAEIFKNLEQNSSEFFVYSDDLRELSRCFKEYSVELLTEADKRAPRRSYDVLCYGFEQYSYTTATHLAYIAENRRFIAHIWCQRWLNRLLYGNMKICKIKPGLFTLKNWCKVLLCALFVVPIKFWVKYPSSKEEKFQNDSSTLDGKANLNGVNEEIAIPRNVVRFNSLTEEVMARVGIIDERHDATASDNQETTTFLHNNRAGDIAEQVGVVYESDPSATVADSSEKQQRNTKEADILFTIYHFYNAPIAKYWLHLVFRIIYLILFGVSLSLPKCGLVILDLIVWVWSFVDWIESLWIIYLKRKNRQSDRSKYDVFDVFIVGTFLFLFMLFKIVSNQTYFSSSAFTGRIIAAFFLLYRCYSTLFTYLPMHSTLGPLLIRIRLMICRDFVNFLILVALIIASFAVVIHATIYPDYPFGNDLWLRAFKRAWFTLFTTPIDDLNDDPRCRSMSSKNPPYCASSSYADPSCPKVSFASYFVVVQYLIVVKLIAWPLLFALFGKTAKEIDEEADVIWKYQFYCMVTDFSLKPFLPPPLTPFSFLFFLCSRCRQCDVSSCFRRDLEPAADHPDVGVVRFGSVVDHGKRTQNANYYSFWRSLARSYYDKRAKGSPTTADETISQLQNELSRVRVELTRINEVFQLRDAE